MINNWNRKTDWTDYQTAKFLSLINGDHKLCNDNERLAQRTVGCPAHQLRRMLSRLSGKTYVYPLQRWDVEQPYSLFEISTNVELQINAGLLETIDAVFSTVQPSPDRLLESLIRFKDVISNHVTVDDTLMSGLQLSKCTSGESRMICSFSETFDAGGRLARCADLRSPE